MAEQAGGRRRPELACTQRFTRYQRDWFTEVRERAAAGEPVALLSADAPHEVYRAMDIPYVVIQWWSSVIAAKQKAPRYLRALAEAGYPDDSEQYNSLPLGELLAADEDPPWGGLPRPAIISAPASTDAMRQLLETTAQRSGAVFYPIEKTVDPRDDPPGEWWTRLPRSWDTFLPAERLDLLTDELTGLIRVLEQATGRRFCESRFTEVMHLANEQAEHNAAARDLVAATVPAPVSVAETMPAVMVPQWHRGSLWARDAAAEFHAELQQRVAAGPAAGPGERVRLMWLGRGLWSSLGLYQYFQDTYGAVFVWSMYLGLAADGYARYFDGRDPLRALAARFVTVGDELRMPAWSAAWHVKEAILHQADGVVSLGENDYFSVRRLEAAGIPVLSLTADNVDRRTWREDELKASIARFIEERALPAAERRHHAS